MYFTFTITCILVLLCIFLAFKNINTYFASNSNADSNFESNGKIINTQGHEQVQKHEQSHEHNQVQVQVQVQVQSQAQEQAIDDLTDYLKLKFKDSRQNAKEITSKLGIELENFKDYAPKNIIVPNYLYFDENALKNNDNLPTASNTFQNDKIREIENISSEMTNQWSEKTSSEAHSYYFKLMDDIPRTQVPDVTTWK